MVSLKNTVKIHNVIQINNVAYYISLQMHVRGAKGLVIAAITLTGQILILFFSLLLFE